MSKIPDSVPWKRTGQTLGEGGQSNVYEVEPTSSEFSPGKYAMKELRNVGSNQARQRFLREIEAIARINDPRIVRVIDHRKGNADFLYYVMPYDPDLTPLKKLVFSEQSPFRADPKECLRLIAECGEALYKVHKENIVHRDLNPSNVLYNIKTRKPLIIDFGCCQMEGDKTITLTDEGVGTPNYMAPECESGASGEPTFKADIYSLGKLLWSMVTGCEAFARETPAFTTKNLKDLFPNDPGCWHVTRVFQKTIRHNPKHRYENAERMAQDCRDVVYLIDHYPPIDRIMQFCPACGQGQFDKPYIGRAATEKHRDFPYLPPDIVPLTCGVCGYVSLWNLRTRETLEKQLKEME